MRNCRCSQAEASGITKEPWHTQPHPQPAALVTIDEAPFVGETPIEAINSWLTPNSLYYARNHYDVPSVDISKWELIVDGIVESIGEFTYSDIVEMPSKTIPVTMECAGNNRTDLYPPVSGNKFQGGAVSTAIWAGVPLNLILKTLGIGRNVKEIIFEGLDSGIPDGHKKESPYGRSLPIETGMHPDTILAYEMNGEPLPVDHGYPLRLVVPGWYGMASVKWLKRISLVDYKYEGFFQKDRYIIEQKDSEPLPLTSMKIKSLFSKPRHGEICNYGENKITGLAWSGTGKVERVEISDDFGKTWSVAQLSDLSHEYTWQQWTFKWEANKKGHNTLMVRAGDDKGNIQPLDNIWNRLGYAVNGVQRVCVNIE